MECHHRYSKYLKRTSNLPPSHTIPSLLPPLPLSLIWIGPIVPGKTMELHGGPTLWVYLPDPARYWMGGGGGIDLTEQE